MIASVRTEPTALRLLGKHSSTEINPQCQLKEFCDFMKQKGEEDFQRLFRKSILL